MNKTDYYKNLTLGAETARQLACYQAYCELGPMRSFKKLRRKMEEDRKKAELLGQVYTGLMVSVITMEKWSSKFKWQERVKSFDAEIAAERETKLAEQRLKMDEQHAILGSAMAVKAIKQIERLIEVEKFGSQASVTLFKYATDLERVARGVPTAYTRTDMSQDTINNIRNVVSIDLSKLNNDQLAMLEQIVEGTGESEEPVVEEEEND